MIRSFFGHVVLLFMLSFASSNLLDEQLQDDGLVVSHLEKITPDFDDNELSNYNDMASRTLTAPPCSTGAKTWVVESTADAQALAEAMNCSGGAFDVEWIGSIIVEETVLVVNGAVLNITGIDSIATIDGGGTTSLFAVSNAFLHLTNIKVSNGNAMHGGAVEASSSELIFHRTKFYDNTADISGGALYLSNNSTISISGESSFHNNHANDSGGAVYVGPSCSMSWAGDIHFSSNTADNSGGAVYVSPIGNASWEGEVAFTGNTARLNGGAMMVDSGSRISWSGEATFSDNVAYHGGALYVLGDGKAIWEGESLFKNNTSIGWGGAVCLQFGGSASWVGQSSFFYNTAYGWIGGAVAVADGDSIVSWGEGNTTFSRNTVYTGNGGAIGVSGHGCIASWSSKTLFSGNTATYKGGAIFVRNNALTTWGGETTFYNNSASYGGAINVILESDVHYSGDTNFLNNSASSGGGAIMVDGGINNLSWSGRTEFFSNIAPDAGAMLVAGIDAVVSWTSPTIFSRNAAADRGGAVLVRDGASASWSGETTFFGNSGNYGGGLFIGDGVDVQLNGDTQFRSNTARSDGGAVASYFTTPNSSVSDFRSSLSINATTAIANNTSEGNGGGVALMTSVSLEVNTTDLTFHGNNAAVSGGAMFISGSEVRTTFQGTRFIMNSAQLGGAIYSAVIGSEVYYTTFKGCSFVDNVAKVSGGAMNSLAGYDSFVDTSFAGNMALVGGALRLAGVSKIENCSFEDNVSGEDEGPAVSNTGAISNLASSYFEDNFFHCDSGMYREFVEEGDFLHAICDGCDDVVCNDCSMEAQLTPKCTSAMEHSTSSGGAVTIHDLEIEKGYWRATNTSTTILACFNPDVCVGGVTGSSSYCTEGYEGPYCSVCSKDYMANQGSSCSRCSNKTRGIVSTVVLTVVGMAIVVLIILYLISPDMQGTRRGILGRVAHVVPVKSLKIMINTWQILTQFSAVANVTFPGVYQRFLDVVASLNFDLTWMLSVGCVVDVDFHDRLLISTLGPILIMGFLVMTYIAAVRKNQSSEEALQNIHYKNVSTVLLFTFLVYSNVSATVFQSFSCDDLDDGNTYLRADYRIQCDSIRHRIFQVYAVLMVIIYPVGIPTVYAVLLFKNRGLLKDGAMRVDALDVKSTSDLWKPYKPSRFYYEVVECVRRIALTGVVVFIYPNTAAQIAVALLMSFTFTLLSACLDPYESRWDSWLNRTGNIVVFTSMFLALALKVDVSDETSESQKVFEAVFVAVHGGMILLVVVEAVTTAYALAVEELNEPKPRYGVGRSLPSSIIIPAVARRPSKKKCSNTLVFAGDDDGEGIDDIKADLGSSKSASLAL